MRVLVTRSRAGRSTVSNYLLLTEDVRIDPDEGLQEYHVMLQDISRGDVNLFFALLGRLT